MTIDWATKRGKAIGFISETAPELADYHPKPDGYHFVQIHEDDSNPEDITFSMTTTNTDVGVNAHIPEGIGWSNESSRIINSLKLRRDSDNPDVLVGGPTIDVTQAGWALIGWRMELHDVELASGTVIEVVSDTLTWERRKNGVPSDLDGQPLPDGHSSIKITTAWEWIIIR